MNDVAQLSPASSGGAVKSPAQGEISDLIDSLANKNQWTGSQLVSDIRSLRDQANANFRAASIPNANRSALEGLAQAQSGASKALEGLAQRNITTQGGDPQAIQLLQEARQYIAKTHDVEDALVNGGGTADARVLARKYDANPDRMSGATATIGAAANNFPKAFQPTASVAGPGASNLGVTLALLNPGSMGAGELATQVVGRPLLRGYQLSKGVQNRLRDIYQLGMTPRVASGLLQYAPVAGAVLGREALSQ
jgi:hypothetical protein